jgi:hypothetical protein
MVHGNIHPFFIRQGPFYETRQSPAGAFGIKHLDGIKTIDGAQVVSLISRELDKTREIAAQYGIGHVSTELVEALALPEVDAVILCTPAQMHASQTLACLTAGKHVRMEIPLCDVLADGEVVAQLAEKSGLLAMCGHTRRFNPSHQYVHPRRPPAQQQCGQRAALLPCAASAGAAAVGLERSRPQMSNV